MTDILSLLSGGWGWLAAIGSVIAALVASYFGGKKIGATQTQAKADVSAAESAAEQSAAAAATQAKNIEVAKNVQSTNAAVSDSAARDKLRASKYNSDD